MHHWINAKQAISKWTTKDLPLFIGVPALFSLFDGGESDVADCVGWEVDSPIGGGLDCSDPLRGFISTWTSAYIGTEFTTAWIRRATWSWRFTKMESEIISNVKPRYLKRTCPLSGCCCLRITSVAAISRWLSWGSWSTCINISLSFNIRRYVCTLAWHRRSDSSSCGCGCCVIIGCSCFVIISTICASILTSNYILKWARQQWYFYTETTSYRNGKSRANKCTLLN